MPKLIGERDSTVGTWRAFTHHRASAIAPSATTCAPLNQLRAAALAFRGTKRCARLREAVALQETLPCRLPIGGTSGSVQRFPANPARPGREQR